MPIISTKEIQPGVIHPYNDQLYNALDCCITQEVFYALQNVANSHAGSAQRNSSQKGVSAFTDAGQHKIYAFERALQAPVLDMMLRGFCVDIDERERGIEYLTKEIHRLSDLLNKISDAVWGRPLNANSHKMLQEFFYKNLRIPEIRTSKKGEYKTSMDREALEKISDYFHARPIVSIILALRDYTKQLGVLKTEVDADWRMRTSYNVAGTETGRFSSSKNAYGTGSNLQNISAPLRKMFVADKGWKICGIDLEQAESREVGWLSGVICGDWSYLDACYSGDLHTLVAQTAWPELGWTDDPKHNRQLADTPFYRNLTYRDMSKKLGHGSNYRGLPPTMAKHAKIPVDTAAKFQAKYFQRFAGIPRWHRWVAQQLQTARTLVTPFGRERLFFGRANDDTTLRAAIAFSPQSATADRLNLILWLIWKHMPHVQLLAQVHDALYFQFPEHLDEQEVVSEALSYFDIPMEHSGHRLIVPGEAKVGWNWGNYGPNNPTGLKKWKKDSPDTRQKA